MSQVYNTHNQTHSYFTLACKVLLLPPGSNKTDTECQCAIHRQNRNFIALPFAKFKIFALLRARKSAKAAFKNAHAHRFLMLRAKNDETAFCKMHKLIFHILLKSYRLFEHLLKFYRQRLNETAYCVKTYEIKVRNYVRNSAFWSKFATLFASDKVAKLGRLTPLLVFNNFS